MKFHNHETVWDQIKDAHPGWSRQEAMGRLLADYRADPSRFRSDAPWDVQVNWDVQVKTALISAEEAWYSWSRPYFKVWPSIAPALVRLSLGLSLNELSIPEKIVAIRFSDFGPLTRGLRVRTVLASHNQSGPHPRSFYVFGRMGLNAEEEEEQVFARIEANGRPITDSLGPENEFTESGSLCLKIALTTFLLANDPSIVKPDVLAADRRKFDETGDMKYVEKAKRRGIVGWRIGEEYESIPHYRRPHFALRHTGPGRTVPRIVPVKGTVVHRDKLTRVPTGYITPDGVEVEP